MTDDELWPYTDRLATFRGHWDDALTAARQLAALGHVCDRPPLESLEEGSRCISCGAFVQKDLSVRALGDSAGSTGSTSLDSPYGHDFPRFRLHHPHCKRLQVRIPLEPQSVFAGLHGGSSGIQDLRASWERRIAGGDRRPPWSMITAKRQTSSLFSLPTELRLAIYSFVLPSFDPVTSIVTLNRDSTRVITQDGYERTGPRDTAKPNLLRTCRAVHAEALDLLYTRTTFRFASTKTMFFFLRSVGATGRELVSAVDVRCGEREDSISFALLAACHTLRCLTLRLPRKVLLFPRAPLWVEEGVSCLKALRGLKEIRFDTCGKELYEMTDEMTDAMLLRNLLTLPRDE